LDHLFNIILKKGIPLVKENFWKLCNKKLSNCRKNLSKYCWLMRRCSKKMHLLWCADLTIPGLLPPTGMQKVNWFTCSYPIC